MMSDAELNTAPSPASVRVTDVASLLEFANQSLPGLRTPSGLMCYDRQWSEPELRGESVRYSIMVLLGLLRSETAGRSPSIDTPVLHQQIAAHRGSLGVGDLGLLLWAETRMGVLDAEATLVALERESATTELGELEGMEIAWFVLGAVEAHVAGLDATVVLERSTAALLRRCSRHTPLLLHDERDKPRSVLPNFATEIYSLLALTELGRHDLTPTAMMRAVRLADLLIELREPDAGWPWLFHAERGVVVEPYEVYSVHQDAMAPMALLALAEVTGDHHYAKAAFEGFGWCLGRNELGFDFYAAREGFAHRSIRRQGLARRGDLWVNSALALAGRRTRVDAGSLEINTTCRPYHLGWMLEAWSGRAWPDAIEGATT